MALACRVVPKVKNKQGEMVNSQLHQDLGLFISDIETRNQLWNIAHSQEFRDAHPDLATDSNGEVTVEDLLGKTSAGEAVSDEQLASGLTEMNSHRKSDATTEGVQRMTRQAAEINEKSAVKDRVVATATVDQTSSKIAFSPKTEETTRVAEKATKGLALHDKMARMLEQNGISVERLTEAEESAGIDGVTDFSATRNAASGFSVLIRLAQGKRGEQALTEEGCHFAVAVSMGQDANVDRALSQLRKNDALVKEVLGDGYEKYRERYKGDKEKLVHEAAGHILMNVLETENKIDEMKEAGRYKSLWRRMKDAILNFIKRFKSTEVERMLHETELSMKPLARQILDDSFYATPNLSPEIEKLGKLFALSEEQKADLSDKSNRLIREMKSRMRQIPGWVRANAKARSGGLNEGYYTKLQDAVNSMSSFTASGKSLASIELYLQSATEQLLYNLKTFEQRYGKAKTEEGKAHILNNINIACKTYARVAADINDILDELEKNITSPDEKASLDRIKGYLFGYTNQATDETIPGIFALTRQCRSKIAKPMMICFVDYIKNFIPLDNIIVPRGGEAYGIKGGNIVDIVEQIKNSPEIGSLDYWVLGASLSNSFPVQVFQRMVNVFKLKIRQEYKEYQKKLQELTLKLEEAGYSNQEFMFERDSEDKLTGSYIKNDSDEYKALDPAQKEFYDAVIEIKKELDDMLPSNMRRLLNAPKIRKDMLEHIQSDSTVPEMIKEKLYESFNFTSDDEYGLSKDTTLCDYDGNEIRVIPIRFLQFAPGEDSQNISTDVANTMSYYAQMCTNYSLMSRLMPAMEIGRTLMEEGSSISTRIERDEEGKIHEETSKRTRGESNGDRTLDRINDILESELYGFKMEHVETEILGRRVSVTKLGQKLLALTAASQYMLSPAAAIQNDITAQIQAALASSEKKYFNKEDLLWAHGVFSEKLIDMFSDIGARYPASKIALFSELMNVMQKDEHSPFNQKGAQRLSGSDLYCLTTSTEFHANMVLALATAHRTKLKTADGSDINFWDALEVVDMATKYKRDAARLRRDGYAQKADELEERIRKHPEWTNSENKFLLLREGVTKADGTEFSFKDMKHTSDLENLIRRSMHTSHMLNGIYNSEDAAKWQRYIGGSMLGMYRKWIAPMWYRRINGLNYSLDEQEWTEGYYRTLFRVGYYRAKALFDKELAQQIKGEKLSEMEKTNIHVATREIGLFIVLLATAALLKSYKKKNRSFAYNMTYYFTARTVSELSSVTPMGIPTESLRIFQNPSAVLPTIANIFGLAGAVFNPTTWGFSDDAYIKSGKYKGLTKLERAAIKAPFLPGVKQWISFLNPEDAVKFYE